MITVHVNGARGKMGETTVQAVTDARGVDLIGQTDMGDDLAAVLKATSPQVVVDFTHPDVVFNNVSTILRSGARALVGTTGLSDVQLDEMHALALDHKTGCLVVPNFAIGAVLMMKFAAEAAKYMPRAEIIEMHHDKKADAPSGTAIKTADMIAEAVPHINAEDLAERDLIPGSRGGVKHRIPIHAVRLPGFVASQEVILGGMGQTLKLRHDTISRESFMPGVILGIEAVMTVRGLVYGLEKVL